MRGITLVAVLAATVMNAPLACAETITVAPKTVADEKAVFATVESISVVPARGRISGTIVQLNVREGDSVTRGQAIAVVADEKLALQMKSLDAQMQALQAQADQAQIDFTRTEGLVDRGILPRTKLDETRTALNVAAKRAACEDSRAGGRSATVQRRPNPGSRRRARAEEDGVGGVGRSARRYRRDDCPAGFQIAPAGAGTSRQLSESGRQGPGGRRRVRRQSSPNRA